MTGRRTDDAQLTASGRLEAFSDEVFAIAITLLVLDIGVPARGDLPAGGLGAALAHPWPSYVAYLATIGLSFVSAIAALSVHAALALYYCFDQLTPSGP